LLALALSAGCGQPAAPLSVSIVPPTASAKAFITVAGFSSEELSALARANFNNDQWVALMRVTVDGPPASNPPVTGQYRVTSTAVDFVPLFPFDPGRGYAAKSIRRSCRSAPCPILPHGRRRAGRLADADDDGGARVALVADRSGEPASHVL
jgi:hypothetical protein